MQSLPYSALTDEQRKRVAYLFADEHFGTDASAFAYEWDGRDIRGRHQVSGARSQTKSRAKKIDPASVKVTMLQEVHITDELIRTTTLHMDALAALIANRIQISNPEEVNV